MNRDPGHRLVAVVTGGSRGIGAATARALAVAGYDLLLTFQHRLDAAEAVADECRKLGSRVHLVQADLADPQAPAAVFAALDANFTRLDLLVNNAGALPPASKVVDIDAERAAWTFAVNTVAPLLCAREAVRRMSVQVVDSTPGIDATRGVIVNVSSRAAVRGASGEFVDYAMSKAAVDALTIGLAGEVAELGIRVNGIRPGLIDTDMNTADNPGRLNRLLDTVPMGRAGTADEVADAICWLAGDRAGYITGVTVDVSGGR